MSMTLRIGFDDIEYGTLSVRDGRLHANGPNVEAVRHVAESHAETLLRESDDVTPDDILKRIAERCQGRLWATPVGDSPLTKSCEPMGESAGSAGGFLVKPSTRKKKWARKLVNRLLKGL